jgi:PAS domain S-box-containing protein
MPAARITVLAVGSDEPTVLDGCDRFDVRTVPTADAAFARLAEPSTTVDCVVVTHDPPGIDGLAVLESVRESHPDLPFVLRIGSGDEGVAERAVEYDATDYYRDDGSNDRTGLLAARIRGIVEANRSRRELERRNRRLETLIDNLPGIVYRCHNEPDWPIEYIAGDCEEITGHPPAAFERGTVSLGDDVIHPDDRASTWQAVQDALDAGDGYEISYRIRTATGDTKWMWERGQGIYTDGDLEALEGFITDVTAREERRDELRRNQRRFEAVFEDPEMLVGLLDLDGTVVRVNETALSYVDVDAEDVIGDPFPETPWWTDDSRDSVQEWIERAADGEYVDYRSDHAGHDGDRFCVSGTIRPVTDEDGEPTSLIASARDVTDRRLSKQRLEESRDKLEILNQVVRHDLRNHMQVVRGRARLLADHVAESGKPHLDEVFLAADEAIDLTETARNLTETMLGADEETRPVSIRRAVESAVETARSRHERAAITVYGLGEDATIEADDMFESVIHNLLQNAIVHNDAELPEVEVTVERDDDTVLLSVADNGPGVPDDRKDAVFGRGNKGLESGGTGIGLYLVRTLVEQYGGEIRIEDNDPTGSVFRVRLPVRSPSA